MKINTKTKFKNFGGTEIKNGDKAFTFGEALSNILLESTLGGKMKLYSLAQRLHDSKGVVEIDDADASLVLNSVESTKLYNNLINGQLLQYLSKLK